VRVFSLLAIATSFIGFCLGLVDFYADLLGVDDRGGTLSEAVAAVATEEEEADPYAPTTAVERPLATKSALYALALVPPLCIATWDPSLFFSALDTAGTFGILTLFGILPASMAWSQRYGPEAEPAVPDVVPGGKVALALMIGGAAAVIALEIAERISVTI